MKTEKNCKQKKLFRVIYVLCTLILFVKVLDFYGSTDSPPEYPDYERLSLKSALDVELLYQGYADEEMQELLFCQTGLGEEALKDIIMECGDSQELLKTLERYQNQLFGETDSRTVVSLEDGDVMVSLSQRLCFYPHGHAAIVTDGETGEILEAKSYVAGSCMGNSKKWSNISSFVILRIKEEVAEVYGNPASGAALYAKNNLNGLEYSLFKDIRLKQDETPEYTQCAHLVWYAYYMCGLDIDENRGIIIKPKDFLESDVFEVVQVFGINPKTLLELRDE